MPEAPVVPLLKVGELCQGGGGDVRGGPAGPIEVYHTLCLCQGGEPLGAPLTLTVGGLVADFDSHWVGVVWYGIILQGQGGIRGPRCASPSGGTSGRGQGDRRATVDCQQSGIHGIQAGFHN